MRSAGSSRARPGGRWSSRPATCRRGSTSGSSWRRWPTRRPNLQTEFVAPRTDLERTLAGVWQSLLALERVGVHDSFFELGGDSLLGIQLTSTLKKQLGAKVSAVTLFEAPTVASLATLIETQGTPAPAVAVDASRLRGERRREKKLRTGEALGA